MLILKFLSKTILPGINITHDGKAGYSFFDDDHSVLTHELHNHDSGDFCTRKHSTSHIAGYWSIFKSVMNKIYPIFQSKEIIYYIREGEFISKFFGKKDNEIKPLFIKMVKIVFEYCSFDFSSEEEIEDYNNYDN